MEQPDLKAITKELESGNASKLSGLLQGKFEEDRINVLKEIRAQNDRDRQADSNVPYLDLNITSSFAGTNSLRLSIQRNSRESFMGGTTLYEDVLDVNKLTHTAAQDAVPANTRDVDVRALTTRLEQGQGKGTEELLAGLKEEERIRVFQRVGALNQSDLNEHKTNVTLDIRITPNKTGQDSINVVRTMPGAHDYWMGGVSLYYSNLDLHSLQRTRIETNDSRK